MMVIESLTKEERQTLEFAIKTLEGSKLTERDKDAISKRETRSAASKCTHSFVLVCAEPQESFL